jgi:hypothetical protein
MQALINIPDDKYEIFIKRMQLDRTFRECEIVELPKGHGRLTMLSEDILKENQINLDFSCQKWISEVGLSNATVAIIEADEIESER